MDDVYALAKVLNDVTNALAAEYAEVERLSGEAAEDAETWESELRYAQGSAQNMLARAERAEAELAEIRVEWGMDAWQTRTKVAEAEVARLTAQLQAVSEYVDQHEHPDDWNVPCVYTDGLRAILDAAAIGGK